MTANCLTCNTEIEVRRTGSNPDGSPMYRKFCNRSCAAILNNRLKPKRLPEGSCKVCGEVILASKSFCRQCRKGLYHDWATLTMAQLHGRAKYQKSASVRGHARKVMKESGLPRQCRVCGYDLHVEVSHKKAIKEWPSSSLVGDVNSLDNLEYLCRNHHWEYEHGLL